MQRVVVTGLGLVSSIGCTTEEGAVALRRSESGLTAAPELQEAGLRCGVYGAVKGWDPGKVPKRARQTMSRVAEYAAAAASSALDDAASEAVRGNAARAGAIVGTAFGGINELSRMHKLLSAGKKSRAGAVGVTKTMNSSVSGNLAALFGLKGPAYSVSSNFASGTDNIGHAYEQIKYGIMDLALCGASEEDCWLQIGAYFDNWGGLPRDYNHRPAQACRPYDAKRQGMVMSAGSGILLLESLEHSRRRGARVYAEVVGYGSANDGANLFQPTGQGLTRAIKRALDEASQRGVKRIDYVNTHGTGTRAGDMVEAAVLREVFGDGPLISSTKGLTGHALGASGALEAVYSLLMMSQGFVAPTVNLETIAPECAGLRHVQAVTNLEFDVAMSFSVGLGGFNSCIVFRRMDSD